MTKKEIYLRLCDKLDALFKEYNPCDFIDGRCRYARENNLAENSCCAASCKQLSPEGCKTKNLMCKIGFGCDLLERDEFKRLAELIGHVRWEARMTHVYSMHFFIDTDQAIDEIKKEECEHYFTEALGDEICINCRRTRDEINEGK